MKIAGKEDYKNEMDAFNDCWKLLKKYYFIGLNMDEWGEMVSEAGDICVRNNTEFCKKLIHLVIDHLGELSQIREAGKNQQRSKTNEDNSISSGIDNKGTLQR